VDFRLQFAFLCTVGLNFVVRLFHKVTEVIYSGTKCNEKCKEPELDLN
jgi:hypothetical protein